MAQLKILAFGDNIGIPILLHRIPSKYFIGIVGATIRPQYFEPLQKLTNSYSIPFLTQPRPNEPEYSAFVHKVKALAPDLIWVNSYSMILRADILSIPRLGGINIHGALLPQYRGSNPTQWAILKGEIETGVTMHEMVIGVDEGAIIGQKKVPLYFEDTWIDIQKRITIATDELLTEKIPDILQGKWNSTLQDESKAKTFKRRNPDDGFFSWDEPVKDIYNKIRALVLPLPGAFYENSDGEKIIINYMLTPDEIVQKKHDLGF